MGGTPSRAEVRLLAADPSGLDAGGYPHVATTLDDMGPGRRRG
ncbi:MAG: hypothetical protein JWM29_1048 [Solirubrobacterales bacterium]|nr:hypothetical protein [Solirubrobacterales bacterium]